MNSIIRPQLVVDKETCKKNIRRMVKKAERHHVHFRPHFKTHQSLEIGELFRQEGVTDITVSSVKMAHFFADKAWKDITIAFPVNLREIQAINELNASIQLNLLVESAESIRYLDEHLADPVSVFVKIDTGYHRAGIESSNTIELERVLKAAADSSKTHIKGLLAHDGHTYHAGSKEEILAIQSDSLRQLAELKSLVLKYSSEAVISVGDTPSCSLSENFEGADEIRPGNFVFYDLQQKSIGSCLLEDISLVVFCPVVSVHKQKQKIIIYGGAVHLSKQSLKEHVVENGTEYERISYGQIVRINDKGWGDMISNTYVSSVSQEHGIVHCGDEEFLSSVKPGDLMGIIPVHSCLAVNLLSDICFI
ncbi:MAG: alanine racemase [Spirochaetia bacterium]|nr:alanine racemase [Spirochaetia bacterium]